MGEDDQGVDWPPCSEEGCIGIRLDAGGKCLAHADGQQLDAELKRLGDEGTIDARGVTISAELLDRILAAAPATSSTQIGLASIRQSSTVRPSGTTPGSAA
jgi:hypothetical protein